MWIGKRLPFFVVGCLFGGMLMGAHGSCAPGCPDGTFRGPDQGCWIDVEPNQWKPINNGELKVKLHTATHTKTRTQQAYRFVFVQDPKEVYTGETKGRFGDWRIQLKAGHKTNSTVLLQWTLRDQPQLRQHQTVRLVASWLQNRSRHYQTLHGTYKPKTLQVSAILPPDIQQKAGLSLFPATRQHTPQPKRTAALLNLPKL